MDDRTSVKICDSNSGEWDAFVRESPRSTFFHQWGWREVVRKTYGHQPFYLMAKKGNRTTGILPLFLMKHWYFGKFMISTPFGDYGGICSDDAEAANLLLERAIELCGETGAKYLELRHFDEISDDRLVTKSSRATLVLELPDTPDEIWDAFKAKVRNQVRKAEKSGLTVEFGSDSLVDEFHGVYAHNMRDLGSPSHGLDFFRNMLKELSGQVEVIAVVLEGRTIGGGVITYFKDTVEIPWASSLRDYLSLCPNNLLYWETMKRSCLKGYRRFCFGRSPWDSGTFRFKKQWGAEPVPLHYQYYLNKIDEMPDYTPSTNPKYDRAVRIWRRLPVGLTKILGPKIIKGIPY